MKLPPYGRNVADAPPGYWERGTRVLIFVGPGAWVYARWWLDESDHCVIPQARSRYTLVLPPESTENAGAFHWPVEDREVVVIDTGAGDEALAPLRAALERDGCAQGEVLGLEFLQPEWRAESRIRSLQPWSWATWDAEVMLRHAAANDLVAAAGWDAVVARFPRLLSDVDFLGELAALPERSYGYELLLACRRAVAKLQAAA